MAVELVRMAREQGLSLTGTDGLLKQLTKTVLETSLNKDLRVRLDGDRANLIYLYAQRAACERVLNIDGSARVLRGMNVADPGARLAACAAVRLGPRARRDSAPFV